MEKSPLRYNDEADRAYGLTGMAISMVVWDGESMLSGVNLDADPGCGLEVTPEFHFAGNPRLSARLAWHQMVKQFELSTAMLLGNAMCRSYVGQSRALTSSATAMLRAVVRDEGRSVCSLDDDEIAHIYDKVSGYLDRLFTHHAVAGLANSFAGTLRERRRLSAAEAIEQLSALSGL